MKNFNVRFRLTSGQTLETVISARNSSDAEKLIKGQYGTNLATIYTIREVR